MSTAPADLVAEAVRILRADPSAGDGCERGNSLAGTVLTRPFGPSGARWASEAAVREARAILRTKGAAK